MPNDKSQHLLMTVPRKRSKKVFVEHRLSRENLHRRAVISLQLLKAIGFDEKILNDVDETLWQTKFAQSQGLLARMAEKALQNRRAGRTVDLDPDKL